MRRVSGLNRHCAGTIACRVIGALRQPEKWVFRQAIPTDSPLYRGRRFNRDTNLNCRGRYARMASDKQAWAQIPEWIVPGGCPSKAGLIHSLPEGWRKDADYRRPLCGEKVHAAAAAGLPRPARPRLAPAYVTNVPAGAPAGREGPASQDASATAV